MYGCAAVPRKSPAVASRPKQLFGTEALRPRGRFGTEAAGDRPDEESMLRKLVRSPLLWIGVVLIAGLIGLRIALPGIVLDYVNKELDQLEGYSGRVEDIDNSLWRGSYQIQGIRIVKSNGRIPMPFFAADELDISVEWGALFDGDIVAEIDLHRPKLNFVKGPTPKTTQVEP